MAYCTNCKEDSPSEFCSFCGRNLVVQKIDKHYLAQEFVKLTGYEKGFIFTAKELLLRPGKIIREYIHTDRNKITKPITFLILASLLYTVVTHFLKVETLQTNMIKATYNDSEAFIVANWVKNNYGYANLLMLLPIAFCTKIIFSKKGYNFYETFVVTAFVMAEGMLLFSINSFMNYFFPSLALFNELVMNIIIYIPVGCN